MATDIKIQRLALSFMWVETLPALLRNTPPQGAPLAVLGRYHSYVPFFESVLRNGPGPEGLDLPWLSQGRQYFWSRYLQAPIPGGVAGREAWAALVPLRGKLPLELEAGWLPGRLTGEVFFYPHGLAFMLTARCQFDLDLRDAVAQAFEARRTGRYRVQGSQAPESVSLDVLAQRVMDALRAQALGPDAPSGAPALEPFSVATVILGQGVRADEGPPEAGEIHRALEALTTWRPTWREDPLTGFEGARLPTRTSPAGHVLYARRRGRAVWFPELFAQEPGKIHSLACYHRNLVLLSMQAESLCRLAAETYQQLHDGQTPSAWHQECAKNAVERLGDLYEGASSTYRSWSARSHIEDNDYQAPIDEVRDYFDMDPLA